MKGPTRPLLAQDERAEVALALEAVDAVTFFDEETPRELGGVADREARNLAGGVLRAGREQVVLARVGRGPVARHDPEYDVGFAATLHHRVLSASRTAARVA